jgi:hypothetical protein
LEAPPSQPGVAPQERAALATRQGELLAKRHTGPGLTAAEFQELMATNEKVAAKRERNQT